MLEQDIAVLTRLDFIFAKASLSRTYNGSEPDALEKTVVGAAGRQLFLLLAGLRKTDRFSADHNRFGLSGSSGYGAGAAGL